jgi:hypothetical protein
MASPRSITASPRAKRTARNVALRTLFAVLIFGGAGAAPAASHAADTAAHGPAAESRNR